MRDRLPPWFADASAALLGRWNQGARDYGERSFTMSAEQLRDEVLQECIDVPGWLFVWWLSLHPPASFGGDRRRAQRVFLLRIEKRVLAGDITSASDCVGRLGLIAEVERLAAIGVCVWRRTREDLHRVVAASTPDMCIRDPKPGRRGCADIE